MSLHSSHFNDHVSQGGAGKRVCHAARWHPRKQACCSSLVARLVISARNPPSSRAQPFPAARAPRCASSGEYARARRPPPQVEGQLARHVLARAAAAHAARKGVGPQRNSRLAAAQVASHIRGQVAVLAEWTPLQQAARLCGWFVLIVGAHMVWARGRRWSVDVVVLCSIFISPPRTLTWQRDPHGTGGGAFAARRPAELVGCGGRAPCQCGRRRR